MRKKNSVRNIAKSFGWRWIFLVSIMLIACCSTSYFIYRFKRQPEKYPVVSVFIVKLKVWLAQRKQGVNTGITKAKQIVANANEVEPVKFEFYTTLPAMQVSVPEVEQTPIKNNRAVEPVKANAVKPKTLAKATIVSPEEIERELSQHVRAAEKQLHKKRSE